MSEINYDGKQFSVIENSESGEASTDTIFRFHQKDDMVWADYMGGEVVLGSLIAKSDDEGNLDARYQHINREGELKTGVCTSKAEMLDDGRIRLQEKWRWTSGDESEGESVIEEIAE